MERRGLLKGVAALVLAGLLKPVAALAAWNKAAFSSKSSADALKSLGAVVPIEITSNIPGTTSLAVLVEKNPYPLVARFDFMEGAAPFVKINAKMGETSDVRVVATAGGKHYQATKEIKVTIGGCGG